MSQDKIPFFFVVWYTDHDDEKDLGEVVFGSKKLEDCKNFVEKFAIDDSLWIEEGWTYEADKLSSNG